MHEHWRTTPLGSRGGVTHCGVSVRFRDSWNETKRNSRLSANVSRNTRTQSRPPPWGEGGLSPAAGRVQVRGVLGRKIDQREDRWGAGRDCHCFTGHAHRAVVPSSGARVAPERPFSSAACPDFFRGTARLKSA